MFFFFLHRIGAHGWTPWSAWSGCTQTCGTGTEVRTRSCQNPAASVLINSCPGDSINYRTCTDSCKLIYFSIYTFTWDILLFCKNDLQLLCPNQIEVIVVSKMRVSKQDCDTILFLFRNAKTFITCADTCFTIWIVPQLSIMIIYNSTWSSFNPMD